jgi:hypothetical protein
MEPAIRPGSLALFALQGFTVQRGGIYVIHPNGHGGGVTYVKRVIGMPGDRVQGVHGLVRICSGPGRAACCKALFEMLNGLKLCHSVGGSAFEYLRPPAVSVLASRPQHARIVLSCTCEPGTRAHACVRGECSLEVSLPFLPAGHRVRRVAETS